MAGNLSLPRTIAKWQFVTATFLAGMQATMADRPLDPTSLQYFIAVCEEGSIARAAEREALVASALSKRISALEAELGSALLVRRRSGIEPTPAGQALLVGARSLLQQHQRLRAELAEFRQGVQGSIRVLASASALAEQLPDDVAGFIEHHPRLRVSLDEAISIEITRAVLEGAADLGVLWDQGDLSGLDADALPQRPPVPGDGARPPPGAALRTAAGRRAGRDDGGRDQRRPAWAVCSSSRRHCSAARSSTASRYRAWTPPAASSRQDSVSAILPREAVAPHAGAGQLALVPLDEAWAQRRFVVVSRVGAVSGSVKLLVGHLAERADG